MTLLLTATLEEAVFDGLLGGGGHADEEVAYDLRALLLWMYPLHALFGALGPRSKHDLSLHAA